MYEPITTFRRIKGKFLEYLKDFESFWTIILLKLKIINVLP